MNFQKKVIFLVTLCLAILALNAREANNSKFELNKNELNVIEILSKQKNECRPSSEFLFYVKTSLSNDRTPSINAKIYMLNRKTKETSLLTDEKIKVSDNEFNIGLSSEFIGNGDEIIGNTTKDLYAFNELIKFEFIYSSYIRSTNKLLGLKRSL